jgi:hypothetical protein
MTQAPIFIVGIPRSGTTLLAAMLAAHSRMSCGPETHFFRRLEKVDPDDLTRAAEWPRAAVDFICSITHTSFSSEERLRLINKYQIEKSQIESYLSSKEPSIPTILSSITEQFMVRMGKTRWVEKTPDHIEHLSLMRKYFPDSPIIRIMRDPRDVALSLRRVPWGAMSSIEAFLYWKDLDQKSDSFFASDSLGYTLRFEDLICTPEEEMKRLCQFIGEEYEPGMLDTSTTGKMLNSRNVPWKDKVSQPIDSDRISLWKREFTPQENRLAESILGDRISAFEYPRDEQFDLLGEVYPGSRLAVKYPDVFWMVSGRGVRFWKLTPNEKPSVRVYLGDPALDQWQSVDKAGPLPVIFDIINSILSRKAIYWASSADERSWNGAWAYLVKWLLNPFRAQLNA